MPVRASAVGEFDALLGNDRVPEVAPLDCGVNVTVKVADCPAGIVAGNEIPESTNSLLESLAGCTVTAAPLAVRMPLSDELDPTLTFPKLRLAGETANVPAAVPVPESAMLSGESDAFDTTDRFPLTAPLLVGAKVAVNVTLWFGVRVIGNSKPLIEKLALLKLTCEIETVDPPVLVSVSDKLAVLPT